MIVFEMTPFTMMLVCICMLGLGGLLSFSFFSKGESKC